VSIAETNAGPGEETVGVTGNRRLTNGTAAVLFVLLAVEGVTILALDSMLPLHIFVGVLLVPPVLLKLASTGYRLLRYYRGSPPYVRRGPPALLLRLLGPLVVVSTGTVLATGIALLVVGPGEGMVATLHKASFIVFFGATSLHVLAHVRRVPAEAAADWRRSTRSPGAGSRRTLLVASLVAGVVIGAVAIACDGAWVHGDHDDDRAAVIVR
jgi:hypothetical protein